MLCCGRILASRFERLTGRLAWKRARAGLEKRRQLAGAVRLLCRVDLQGACRRALCSIPKAFSAVRPLSLSLFLSPRDPNSVSFAATTTSCPLPFPSITTTSTAVQVDPPSLPLFDQPHSALKALACPNVIPPFFFWCFHGRYLIARRGTVQGFRFIITSACSCFWIHLRISVRELVDRSKRPTSTRAYVGSASLHSSKSTNLPHIVVSYNHSRRSSSQGTAQSLLQ